MNEVDALAERAEFLLHEAWDGLAVGVVGCQFEEFGHVASDDFADDAGLWVPGSDVGGCVIVGNVMHTLGGYAVNEPKWDVVCFRWLWRLLECHRCQNEPAGCRFGTASSGGTSLDKVPTVAAQEGGDSADEPRHTGE
jgi:hypothetical protein